MKYIKLKISCIKQKFGVEIYMTIFNFLVTQLCVMVGCIIMMMISRVAVDEQSGQACSLVHWSGMESILNTGYD